MKYKIKLAAIMTSIGCGKITYSASGIEKAKQEAIPFLDKKTFYKKIQAAMKSQLEQYEQAIKTAESTDKPQLELHIAHLKSLLELSPAGKLIMQVLRAKAAYALDMISKSSIWSHMAAVHYLFAEISDFSKGEIFNKMSAEEKREYAEYFTSLLQKNNQAGKIQAIIWQYIANAFTKTELEDLYSVFEEWKKTSPDTLILEQWENAFIAYFTSLNFASNWAENAITKQLDSSHAYFRADLANNRDAFDFLLQTFNEHLEHFIKAKAEIERLTAQAESKKRYLAEADSILSKKTKACLCLI